MASILPHQGGYRVQLTVKGERDSKVFATKREAQQWAAMRETEMRAGLTMGGKRLSQAITRYLKDVSSTKAGERWEKLRLAAMLAHFGDVQLSKIRPPEIAAWRDTRLQTVSGSTVQRERNLLRNVFTKARLEWRWMDQDPFAGVEMPKEADARTAIWDWRRILAVLRFLNYRPGVAPETAYQQVALAFMIGLHTSLRASEILRVGPDTLNQTTRVIRVKTKTMKLAQVPITRRAVKVCRLANFTINAQNLDALFRKARDRTQAGDLTFHDSRAFALTMLAARVDLKTLARISQHKDLNMLMRYYRESPDQIAARL